MQVLAQYHPKMGKWALGFGHMKHLRCVLSSIKGELSDLFSSLWSLKAPPSPKHLM